MLFDRMLCIAKNDLGPSMRKPVPVHKQLSNGLKWPFTRRKANAELRHQQAQLRQRRSLLDILPQYDRSLPEQIQVRLKGKYGPLTRPSHVDKTIGPRAYVLRAVETPASFVMRTFLRGTA
jgi:hypothetical protein